jgi:transcriptional regulator with XRE-family HTH domain
VLTLATAIDVSRPQLSKILRGRAHIDLEQFDAICDRLELDSARVLAEAKLETARVREEEGLVTHAISSSELDTVELTRRLRLLVETVAGDDAVAAYRKILPALTRTHARVSPAEWRAALEGELSLTFEALSAIADGLGVPTGYLTRRDIELTDRVEAEFALANAMSEAGATRMAARGHLSPDALREIAALVSRRISKQ